MRQSCCASLATEWEIAGIKAVQLSCVYGVPIISDSGRKDSLTARRTTKTQERCWRSGVYSRHTAGAAAAGEPPQTRGQKTGAEDCDCHRGRSTLKLIADRKRAPLTQILHATGALLEGCNAIPRRNYIIRHFVNEAETLPRALLWDSSMCVAELSFSDKPFM